METIHLIYDGTENEFAEFDATVTIRGRSWGAHTGRMHVEAVETGTRRDTEELQLLNSGWGSFSVLLQVGHDTLVSKRHTRNLWGWCCEAKSSILHAPSNLYHNYVTTGGVTLEKIAPSEIRQELEVCHRNGKNQKATFAEFFSRVILRRQKSL